MFQYLLYGISLAWTKGSTLPSPTRAHTQLQGSNCPLTVDISCIAFIRIVLDGLCYKWCFSTLRHIKMLKKNSLLWSTYFALHFHRSSGFILMTSYCAQLQPGHWVADTVNNFLHPESDKTRTRKWAPPKPRAQAFCPTPHFPSSTFHSTGELFSLLLYEEIKLVCRVFLEDLCILSEVTCISLKK